MKGIALVAFALAAGLLLAATGAHAEATFVTGTDCGAPATDGTPAKEWIDDDNVDHARGVPITAAFTGDFPATVTGVEGWNVDITTGAGDAFGTMTAIVQGYGTFSGRFNITWFPGVDVFYGHATLKGDAGIMTAEFITPSAACAGAGGMIVYATILSPHG